jgi:hypothetical protein
MKFINALRGQNAGLLNIKEGGIHNYHCALKDYNSPRQLRSTSLTVHDDTAIRRNYNQL